MLNGFKALGFDTGQSKTPIIPLIVGDDQKAFTMARMLHDKGIFANVAVSPAVPNGRALIRTSYMATHTDEQLDRVLKAFEEVGKALGII
jgi:7-keto-8-aminopelargonate synthetase-like enzyme